jgi:nitrate/nitrite-specific signal transduction histidine kinase
LNNIAKHASASQVTLLVRSQAKGLSLSIEDNGVGFNPAGISSEHLGLKIMNERSKEIGADLTIESQIGSGTKIVACWEPKRESIPGQQGQ